MAKPTKDARVKLSQNKKLRRRWLTWLRMARYGANNFTRNIWLTTAATAVMTITLLIIFTTFVAREVLVDTVQTLRERVEISVYLKDEVTNAQVAELRAKILQDENVSAVRYISVDEARESYVSTLDANDTDQLEAIAELPTNPFPPSLRIGIKNPDELSTLENIVTQDQSFKDAVSSDPRRQPTFAGERREVIDTIGRWATTAEQAGIILSAVFVAISMLIIFNTIRMAIFNRKEEIQMMKLIGADKNFIRGPFVIEAVMYGFIAALAATFLGFTGLYSSEPALAGYGISIGTIKADLVLLAPLVLLAMIIIGALIGVISSRLAVKRYLKV